MPCGSCRTVRGTGDRGRPWTFRRVHPRLATTISSFRDLDGGAGRESTCSASAVRPGDAPPTGRVPQARRARCLRSELPRQRRVSTSGASSAERDEKIAAFRKALDETGPGGDHGHHEPVRGTRSSRTGAFTGERARGPPVRRPRQGDAQPGTLAAELGAKAYVFWGGRGGRGSPGAAKDIRTALGKVQRGAGTSCRSTSSTRGTTSGFVIEPKPNEAAPVTILLPTLRATPIRVHQRARAHPEIVRRQPRGSATRRWPGSTTRTAIAQAMWPRQAVSTSTSTASTARATTRTCGSAPANAAPGRVSGVVDTLAGRRLRRGPCTFRLQSRRVPRTTRACGASAAACMRKLPDPAGEGEGRSRADPGGPGGPGRRAPSPSSPSPTPDSRRGTWRGRSRGRHRRDIDALAAPRPWPTST